MNADKEKVWKAISKTELKLSPGVKELLPNCSDDAREMVAELQDKLDNKFTLSDVSTLVDPNTFEPMIVMRLIKTVKK